MHDIKIRFGESWKEDEILFSTYRATNEINLNNVLDVVDILIDRVNVSVRVPRDSIFLILRDLLSKLEEILTRRVNRVTIPFYESSWEFVISLEGSQALVSFYRAGARPYVEIKDRVVSFHSLVQAITGGGEALIESLLEIKPEMVATPFISELMGAIERIKSMDIEEVTSEGAPLVSSLEITSDEEGEGNEVFKLGYRALATSRDLLTPVIPNRADLYALMAKGGIYFRSGKERVIECECFVFFVIEKLLELCRTLLGCVEDFKSLDLVSDVEGIEFQLKYSPHTKECTFIVKRGQMKKPTFAVAGLDPFVLVDETIRLSKDFKKKVAQLNPSQRANLKFEVFSMEIDALISWRKDFETQTVKKGVLSSLKYEIPQTIGDNLEKKGSGVFTRTKKLMYVQLWEAQVEGFKLDSSYLCGDRLILTGKNECFAIERYSGDLLWRINLSEPDALSFMTGETGILRFDQQGLMRLIDIKTGETIWSSRITPPFGFPSGIVAGGGRRPRFVVLTSGESSIVGIDLFTGEAKWRYKTRRGSGYKFAKFGKLLFITCNTNAIHCLDVDSGELLWRYCGRHKFMDAPVCFGGVVVAWGREWGERMGKLMVFESITGEEMWSADCEGSQAVAPVSAGNIICGAFKIGHDLVIKAWNVDNGHFLWERDLGNLASFFSWMSIDDRIVMNAAGGIVICMRISDGTFLWSRNLGNNNSEDVPVNLEPVLRGGGLFVPADTTYVFSPVDGTLLHRLNDESPVPDFLRVDENYSIFVGEISGLIGAYGISGHVGIVEKKE